MVVCLLGGCGLSTKAPSLSLSKVEVGEQTEQGVVLYFNLDAQNQNEVELPLRQVKYALRVGGKEVFRGVRSPEASLRRLGTQRVRFPAVVPAASIPAGALAFEVDGVLEYATPGQIAELLYDVGLRNPSVGFREAGTVDLASVK